MNEAIKDRIGKLLKLSRSSNENEASHALAKAMDLAAVHGLDISAIELNESSIVRIDLLQPFAKIPVWMLELAAYISVALSVRNLHKQIIDDQWRSRWQFQAVGYRQDAELFKLIFESCVDICEGLTKAHMKTKRFRIERNRRKYRDSFCIGVARGLGSRAYTIHHNQTEVQQDTNSRQHNNEIMINKRAAIQKFLDDLKVTSGKSKPVKVDSKAAIAGAVSASTAEITRPIAPGYKQLNG